jgi:hypothetical protein
MTNGDIPHATPASWAFVEARLPLYQGDDFSFQPEDEKVLTRLGRDARELEFEDQQYFVETSRALSLPVSFEADQPVRYGNLFKLAFEGTFKCYSKVLVGRIIGAKSVRAFCLTFDDVLLLPYFDKLPEDRLLHVPILAVDSMEKTI